MFPLGAIFGGPIGGWAIDRFGRKSTIMFCVVPFQLGWLLLAYAQNRGMLYAGRAITGIACGIISLAVPVSFDTVCIFNNVVICGMLTMRGGGGGSVLHLGPTIKGPAFDGKALETRLQTCAKKLRTVK